MPSVPAGAARRIGVARLRALDVEDEADDLVRQDLLEGARQVGRVPGMDAGREMVIAEPLDVRHLEVMVPHHLETAVQMHRAPGVASSAMRAASGRPYSCSFWNMAMALTMQSRPSKPEVDLATWPSSLRSPFPASSTAHAR